jgi:hypothetical protein
LPRGLAADERIKAMSTPPPTSSSGPPSTANPLREYVLAMEAERSWRPRRGGQDALRLSALGAVVEHDRLLREPLKLPLGTLQLGLVEPGSATAEGRFPVLRRLSATAVVPREQGIEGWLWTRPGGSAMTMLGDEDDAPNAALLFTKPLAEELVVSAFEPAVVEALAARSPLGAPAVYGFLFRVTDTVLAQNTFRQFGLLRPLTDREVPPTLRRSLPTDRPADPTLRLGGVDVRAATSVAPPGMG